jgi:hypothetical protein
MLLLLTFVCVAPAIFFLRGSRARTGAPVDAH